MVLMVYILTSSVGVWVLVSESLVIMLGNKHNKLDIVGTVYHLVMYMQSNKIHKAILMSEFYSALM